MLNTVVFMGSARNVVAPWGGDSRMGDKVLRYVVNMLNSREEKLGDETVKHSVTVYDPLIVFGKGGALESSGAEMQEPSFFLKEEAMPEGMKAMRDTIKAADCYVVVTCEYNHTIPPALSSMMGHFGGSNYACKPSGIIAYSPGPYAGARVAMALRPMLSELGCLPVSKLALLASPNDMLTAEGAVQDPSNPHRMLKQIPDMLKQLEWMAVAMAKQRTLCGPC